MSTTKTTGFSELEMSEHMRANAMQAALNWKSIAKRHERCLAIAVEALTQIRDKTSGSVGALMRATTALEQIIAMAQL